MILIIGGYYQGKHEYVKNKYGDVKITDNVYDKVCDFFDSGLSKEEALNRILLENPDVIICEEVGSGIIPMEKRLREIRDYYGQILLGISKKADKVERVICGISQILK